MREGWRTVRLGDLCALTKGAYATEKTKPGPYPLVVTAGSFRTADSYQLQGEAVCIPTISSTGHGHASLKRVHYVHGKFAVANLLVAAQPRPESLIDTRWLWLYLDHRREELIVPLMQGTANVNLKPSQLANIPIDLPPLTEQRHIVDLVYAIDEARCGARVSVASQQTAGALLRTIEAETADWTTLSQVVLRAKAGATPSRSEPGYWGGHVPWLKSAEVDADHIRTTSETITERGLAEPSAWIMPSGTVVVAMYGQGLTAGSVGYTDAPMCANQAVLGLVPNAKLVQPRFLFHWLRGRKDAMRQRRTGSSQPNLNKELVLQERVPVLDVAREQEVAAVLDDLAANAQAADAVDDALVQLRGALLADLLSGDHVIPASYDRFLDGAA